MTGCLKCASRIRNLNLAEWRRSGRLTGTTPLSAAAPLIQIQAEKLPLARVKSAARPAIVILFIAYGAYTAFISGAERAFIVESSPSGL